MLEQTGNALIFYAHYIESKVGKTGLTVTVDVYRNGTEIVTAGNTTEVGDGLYKYQLASGSNNAEGEYICIFKTATSTVDQQHIPALWVVNKAGTEYLLPAVVADVTKVNSVTLTGNGSTIPWGPA
jgi:5-hydroxyisourate hydrolase-like protein (transthyretin family)